MLSVSVDLGARCGPAKGPRHRTRLVREPARGDRARAPPTTYRTKSGKTLTEADLDALANEVAIAGYDTETLKGRRRGRPLLGTAPAEVVPVRLDPELRAAIEARAEADDTNSSEIIRRA